MTPERAKELLPIIEAYSKGAKIQFLYSKEDNIWEDTSLPVWGDDVEYRIKPHQARAWFDEYNESIKISKEDNWEHTEKLAFFGGWKSKPFDLTEN